MLKRPKGWYPISSTGRVLTASYVCVPAYVAITQWLGVYPPSLTAPLVGGMALVMVCAAVSKRQKRELFRAKPYGGGGFTLVELLVVISIIGMLAVLIFPLFAESRKKAQFARAKTELRNIAVALERYALDHGGYPPDVSRDLPPGLEQYLAGGTWPKAAYAGSVYDWDNWSAGQLQYGPQTPTQQISIRFCTSQANCTFPATSWAANFDYYSALYYCIAGSCRAHADMPTTHPSLCVNCGE